MLPQELVAKLVIPHLRALVAINLAEEGLGQARISRLLGVSQPMVSKYLSEGKEAVLAKLVEAGVKGSEAQAIATLLSKLLRQGRIEDYMRVMSSYANLLLRRKVLCDKHHKMVPGLPRDCNICESLFAAASDPYIEEVRQAFETLKHYPGAHKIIPEVGSNIVAAIPGAKSVNEVIGFTGRIVRVGTEIEAVGDPSYGGSRHTGTILLIVHNRWPHLRGAIVIRNTGACIEVLRRRGLNIVETGPHRSETELFYRISQKVNQLDTPPDAIADRGGVGIEPVIYVFGKTPIEAVEKALNCVEKP